MEFRNGPLPSSPSLHCSEQSTISTAVVVPSSPGENAPLLGSTEDVEVAAGSSGKKSRWWDLRSLVLVAVLWIIVLFIGAAYSMIAPFFPQEVCTCTCVYSIIMCMSVHRQ